MTELEKLKRAHRYLTQLAEGTDPLTETELQEDTVLNNVRLARCFYYVSGILEKVVANGGEVGRRRSSRSFSISAEELAGIAPSPEPLSIKGLCELVSAGQPGQKKLHYAIIAEWLAEKGLLTTETVHGKRRRRVTAQGERLGIREERRQGAAGEYWSIFYTTAAQQFILDNLPEMLAQEAGGGE